MTDWPADCSHGVGPGRVEEAWKRRDEYKQDKDGRVGVLGLQAEASGN